MVRPGADPFAPSLVLQLFISVTAVPSTCPVVSSTVPRLIDLHVEKWSRRVLTKRRLGWKVWTFVI